MRWRERQRERQTFGTDSFGIFTSLDQRLSPRNPAAAQVPKHFVQLIFHIGHPPLQAFIPIRSQAMQQDRLLDGTTSCQRYRIRDYPLTRKNKTLKEIRVMRSGCSPWALTQHYSESVVGKLHHSCSSSWQQLSDNTICTRLNRSE